MPGLSTLIVGLVLLALFGAVVVRSVRNRRRGKGGCSCGCDQCPGHDLCHPQK